MVYFYSLTSSKMDDPPSQCLLLVEIEDDEDIPELVTALPEDDDDDYILPVQLLTVSSLVVKFSSLVAIHPPILLPMATHDHRPLDYSYPIGASPVNILALPQTFFRLRSIMYML